MPVARIVTATALLALSGMLLMYREGADTATDIVDLRERPEVRVVLTDKGFDPRNLRISKGTHVTFTTTRPHDFWPASNSHPAHGIYPAFDPRQPISASSSWSFVFDTKGSWGYHDHIRSYFVGEMYVE